MFVVYVLRSSLFSLLGFFNDAGCMAALEAEHYLQEIVSRKGKADWWVPVRVQSLVVGCSGWVVDPDILGSLLKKFDWDWIEANTSVKTRRKNQRIEKGI